MATCSCFVARNLENTKIPFLVWCAVRTIAVNTTIIEVFPVMCAQRTPTQENGILRLPDPAARGLSTFHSYQVRDLVLGKITPLAPLVS